MQVSISPRKGSRGFAFGGEGDDPNVTDDAGRFTVDNAPAGRVRMMIVPRDFGDETYGWTNTYGAIPIDVDSYDLGDLYVVRSRKKRSAEDGDLGFKLEERPPDVEPEEHPRRVAFVRPGGPAETAGLKVGDVIISVDGHDITAVESYSIYTALTNVGPGTTIELGLDAGGTRSLTASPKP
jgi:membrane-associated protease RseP (regulator of RpoE activity)